MLVVLLAFILAINCAHLELGKTYFGKLSPGEDGISEPASLSLMLSSIPKNQSVLFVFTATYPNDIMHQSGACFSTASAGIEFLNLLDYGNYF